jgi:hypothetical protein
MSSSDDKGLGEPTGKLQPDHRRSLTIPNFGASFGSRFVPEDLTYHPVPYNYASIKDPKRWRIRLKFAAPAPTITVGLDIYEDVILGRGSKAENSPDVDLTNLNASNLGVSRRHAMLRPTVNQLFLIDRQSTNGSFVNTIPIGKGMAQSLKTGDTVSLAGLTFEVEVVLTPSGPPAKRGYPNDDAGAKTLPAG